MNSYPQNLETAASKSSQPFAPHKKIYEVSTSSLGKLTIQITKFDQYIMIVISLSGALKLDGYLQIAYPTPYSDKPLVINIQKAEGQMDNQTLSQLVSQQLNCPIFLSYNIEELNKASQEELIQTLRKILLPEKLSKQSKQSKQSNESKQSI